MCFISFSTMVFRELIEQASGHPEPQEIRIKQNYPPPFFLMLLTSPGDKILNENQCFFILHKGFPPLGREVDIPRTSDGPK